MKVLLAIPNWTFKETHLAELQEDVAGHTAPSGILYIASVLREGGHEVKVLDGAFYTQKGILDEIEKFNADVLGLSVVSMLWENAKKLAEAAKAQNRKLFIIAGGPHPTALPYDVMGQCKAIDVIAVGEAEHTTLEVVNAFENKKSFGSVLGIFYRTGERHTRRIVATAPRPLLQDLDQLPYPAFDLINIGDYRPSIGHYKKLPYIGVVLSRGCPMNCLYCYKLCGNTIRVRDPVKVADEIEYYVKEYGIKEVKFWTELFTAEKDVVFKLCDEIIKRKLNIVWSCTSRVDTINEELAKKMKEAGCWYLQFGIESGVQKNLNTLRKGTKIETIRKAVALTHKAGLKSFCSFILGIPGETYEEAKQTIEFACELNPYYAEFFPLTPFPGTDLYKDLRKYGKMIGTSTDLTMHHIPFIPYSMAKEQLEELQHYAFKRFYMRPGFILMRLASIRSIEDVKIGWNGFKALLSFTQG